MFRAVKQIVVRATFSVPTDPGASFLRPKNALSRLEANFFHHLVGLFVGCHLTGYFLVVAIEYSNPKTMLRPGIVTP